MIIRSPSVHIDNLRAQKFNSNVGSANILLGRIYNKTNNCKNDDDSDRAEACQTTTATTETNALILPACEDDQEPPRACRRLSSSISIYSSAESSFSSNKSRSRSASKEARDLNVHMPMDNFVLDKDLNYLNADDDETSSKLNQERWNANNSAKSLRLSRLDDYLKGSNDREPMKATLEPPKSCYVNTPADSPASSTRRLPDARQDNEVRIMLSQTGGTSQGGQSSKMKTTEDSASRPNSKRVQQQPQPKNIYFTRSTVKYLMIAFVSLCLMVTFVFITIIGSVNFYACPFGNQMAVYLILMGCACQMRLILFYACPFDYSKSMLLKMYEHIIWRLFLNRFSASYYAAIQMSASANSAPSSPTVPSRYRRSSPRSRSSRGKKIENKAKCICSFLLSYFDCCCCLCCYQILNCCDWCSGANRQEASEPEDEEIQIQVSNADESPCVLNELDSVHEKTSMQNTDLPQDKNHLAIPMFDIESSSAQSSSNYQINCNFMLQDSKGRAGSDRHHRYEMANSKSYTNVSRLTTSSGLSTLVNDLNMNCFGFLSRRSNRARNEMPPTNHAMSLSNSESFFIEANIIQEETPKTFADVNHVSELPSSARSSTKSSPSRFSSIKKFPRSQSSVEMGGAKNRFLPSFTRSASTSSHNSPGKFKRHATFDASTLSRQKKTSTASLQTHKQNHIRYHHVHFHHSHGKYHGAHRKVRIHHNKMQKRYRLIDFKSIRFGLATVLQRCLDLFMVIWFICGNYWVFNFDFSNSTSSSTFVNSAMERSTSMTSIDPTSTLPAVVENGTNRTLDLTTQLEWQRPIELQKEVLASVHPNYTRIGEFAGLGQNDSYLLKCNSFSYHVAFLHIMITYAVFGALLILLTVYRIYSAIHCSNKHGGSQNGLLDIQKPARLSNRLHLDKTTYYLNKRGRLVKSHDTFTNKVGYKHRSQFYYNPKFHQVSTTQVSIFS